VTRSRATLELTCLVALALCAPGCLAGPGTGHCSGCFADAGRESADAGARVEPIPPGDGGDVPDADFTLDALVMAPPPVLGTGPITDWEWDHPTFTRGLPYAPGSERADCVSRSVPAGFPGRAEDDYLHEERFAGFEHLGLMIVDHCLYRKLVDRILPDLRAANPDADLCGIDYVIRNPENGETIRFQDIYGYRDADGASRILNVNAEVFRTWPELVTGGSVTLAIRVRHLATGADASNGHEDIGATLRSSGF